MTPVDVTWEDLLRGILAADTAVVPDDDLDYRGAVVTAFAEAEIVLPTPTDLSGVSTFVGLRYPVRRAALCSAPEEIVRFLWENPTVLAAAGNCVLTRAGGTQRARRWSVVSSTS